MKKRLSAKGKKISMTPEIGKKAISILLEN